MNIILFEDHKEVFSYFKSILEARNDLNLLNTEWTNDFQEMERIGRQYLDQADLWIMDIALSHRTNDASTWATQLLLNIGFPNHTSLRRKGAGIAFMTQFTGEEVTVRMERCAPSIFTAENLAVYRILKGNFAEEVDNLITRFQGDFFEAPNNGGWYRENLLYNYILRIQTNRYSFHLMDGVRNFLGEQIIALTPTTLTYEDNDRVHQVPINLGVEGIRNFMENTHTLFIENGRDRGLNLINIQETIYFLHIRTGTEITLINLTKQWNIERYNNNRQLTLVNHPNITFRSSFLALNELLDQRDFG